MPVTRGTKYAFTKKKKKVVVVRPVKKETWGERLTLWFKRMWNVLFERN
jgi:hypothetical protein